MTNKSVLITGANKSIGFETARQLGLLGYKVWLACRDEQPGHAALNTLTAEGLDVHLTVMDVTQAASVQAAAEQVLKSDGKLDILINNAGIAGIQPVAPSEQPVSDIMAVYNTNVFGAISVTQCFIPLLKLAPQARVIMVSSGLGSLAWVADRTHPYSRVQAMGYTSSKTAMNGVTVAFAHELTAFGISVNAVDPGYTATDFNGHTGYRTVEEAADGIVWLADQAPQAMTAGFFFDRNRAPW